ncbi:hypothetical protein FRB99_005476 [Tulasnella sp. 403]|nr:hypothetical protein FRB99_005476 [Tulasnella sp. 403]
MTPRGRVSFPHPFKVTQEYDDDDTIGDPSLTVVEQRMSGISYALRSKPNWWEKYRQPDIRAKWKDEAMAIEFDHGMKLRGEEVDYVLDELDGFHKMRDDATGVEQANYHRIYQSDKLIAEDARQRLIDGVARLENVPDEKKDWHPRSNQLVLDLVHPSLYCLVYGRTLGYPKNKDRSTCTTTDLAPIPAPDPERLEEEGFPEYTISTRFQWIPTDFSIAPDGSSAKALGYINNLHPSTYADLYPTIEALVARFSFLFDRVLTDLHPHNLVPFRTNRDYRWIGKHDVETFDRKAHQIGTILFPIKRTDQDDEEYGFGLPTVPQAGYTEDLSQREARYSIQGRNVQIIVKIANIHLTPEKPEYSGGEWHIEGMANEHIVASGIYYYSSENVTESSLSFRTSAHFFFEPYEQDDDQGVLMTWGMQRYKERNQNLGSVLTPENRCIAFPNLYQHRVSPFKLVDPTKPGHRKIIALFLVDPAITIPSTTQIPPQQRHWRRDAAIQSTSPDGNAVPTGRSHSGDASKEALDMVMGHMERSMTEEEAKAYREELMDERTSFVANSNENYFAMTFNFCEH